MQYRTIALIGYPGTGKTSVGKILDKANGYKHYSNGEELRKLMFKKELPVEIEKYMNNGLAIPMSLVFPIIKKIIHEKIKEGKYIPSRDILILDGLPRDEKQLVQMKKFFQIFKVFCFFVNNKEVIMKRIKNKKREKRKDDKNPKVIKRRINLVDREINNILRHFHQDQITRINSEKKTIVQIADLIENKSSINHVYI
jgi:adenylate kinase family enzyme